MKNTNAIPDKNIIVKGSVDLRKLSFGHQPRRNGAGAHKHKNERRQGTRSQRNNNAIENW